ncbi:lipopolysaccharide assembly protein LapB [Thermoactinomyces sp. DSM 45892]|uniref:tetratricopeptide repeat protein n=1 Tax=Thermoactinomyces sp. DSM 45892 TaxID=1882753 RepID=UPI0008987B28|nr:tetratricopeptide repeat protein [Thermoactinomyces sp. DSM 45892]SDX92659.1 Tetratricopeptide repeat-containing protein [Thermoactinomyces sp. DSM 45892]
MSQWDRVELGKFLAVARKKKKKRQIDLAIEGELSKSTVCGYEKGNLSINERHLLLILKQLDLAEEDVKKFRQIKSIQPENRRIDDKEEIQLRLISIENIIAMVDPTEGLKKLLELPVANDDPIQVDIRYLRGKAYKKKENWKKAHKNLFDAIQLIDQKYPQKLASNIKTACYQELSHTEYHQNNLHQAFKYASDALNCFQPHGERTYLEHVILVAQVIYHQKLMNWEEAQLKLEEIANIQSTERELLFQPSESNEINLNVYELNASILAKGNKKTQAIKYALKGIEMARLDKMHERSFELFTTLGSIYMELDKLNLAEICFETALKLEVHIKKSYLFAYIYTQLGMLYDKRDQLDLAESYFFKAINYSRKNNDAYWETEALTLLGKSHLEHQKLDRAVDLLQDALSLAQKHNFSDQEEYLTLLVGYALEESGNSSFGQYALAFYRSHVKKSLKSVVEGRGGIEMNKVTHGHGDPIDT